MSVENVVPDSAQDVSPEVAVEEQSVTEDSQPPVDEVSDSSPETSRKIKLKQSQKARSLSFTQSQKTYSQKHHNALGIWLLITKQNLMNSLKQLRRFLKFKNL